MRRFQEPGKDLRSGKFLLPFIEVKTQIRQTNKRDAETKEDRKRVNIFLGGKLSGNALVGVVTMMSGRLVESGGAPQINEDADARNSSMAFFDTVNGRRPATAALRNAARGGEAGGLACANKTATSRISCGHARSQHQVSAPTISAISHPAVRFSARPRP